ncbi:GNAT family N-acetyltransferase [Acinetobacter sp. EC24]|nr:GNAT family N-acetyltransferase [Acinetobacter rathckeae]MBF7694574.1 GNAT family N-acetyltransferase [Acinetobacter rathckeae]
MGEKFWGKGIATEATKMVIDIAFHKLKFERLETSALPWNTQSIRVLQKCGFSKKANEKNRIIKDGKSIDCDIYFIINSNDG